MLQSSGLFLDAGLPCEEPTVQYRLRSSRPSATCQPTCESSEKSYGVRYYYDACTVLSIDQITTTSLSFTAHPPIIFFLTPTDAHSFTNPLNGCENILGRRQWHLRGASEHTSHKAPPEAYIMARSHSWILLKSNQTEGQLQYQA